MELKSYTGTYKMYVKDGQVFVEGTGKFKNFVGIFYLSEVRDLIKTDNFGNLGKRDCDK